MFPPARRAQTGPPPPTRPARTAATGAAPAPSTTSFDRSRRRTIACEISSSSTTTTSSISSSRISRVSVPGCFTAMPSAIVAPDGSLPANGAQAADWTPTILTSGRRARSAIAVPAASPPPPTGITTVSSPDGSCPASSRPRVPCPATTRASSKACTNVAPVSASRVRAIATVSSNPSPASSTVAP